MYKHVPLPTNLCSFYSTPMFQSHFSKPNYSHTHRGLSLLESRLKSFHPATLEQPSHQSAESLPEALMTGLWPPVHITSLMSSPFSYLASINSCPSKTQNPKYPAPPIQQQLWHPASPTEDQLLTSSTQHPSHPAPAPDFQHPLAVPNSSTSI